LDLLSISLQNRWKGTQPPATRARNATFILIPKAALKGLKARVGVLRALSRNFGAVENDELDMAVDDISIGNVN
jgi:hypothetical protein